MRRSLFFIVPAAALLTAFFFVAVAAPWLLRHQPYAAPKQPIAFNHRVHVEGLGMDCAFCHRTAEDGVTAGYPDLEQCMFCHQVVSPEVAAGVAARGEQQQGAMRPQALARPGPSEIQKVRQAWVDQEAVDWIRVHRMPDHSRFVHDAHLRAGISCAVCHGNVGAMGQAVKVRPLNMADCVACHQETGAPTDCATCHY